MQLQTDKRLSPRIATDFPVKLLPDDIEGNVLNISETGICFDCEKSSLPDDILLSIDSESFKLKPLNEISAKVVWHKTSTGNRFQFGARFSLLDKENLSTIRDFIFDNLAQKASSIIEGNKKDIKEKVKNFFSGDIRKYHEDLSDLAQEMNEGKIGSSELEEKVSLLTNELLLKGESLQKVVNNDICMKKIKQIFRDVVGCWFYKSPIMKMAYDKPRGYPGDFELFEIIYQNKPLSENKTTGFYGDKYFLNNEYAMAARARKNKMKNILQDFIENTSLSAIRLLNVACGPSREIRELFSEPLLLSEISKKKIIFTGLDNDEDALKFSKSALNNLPSNIETRFLHENVLNIFRDKKYYDIIGKQDIIYILGLTEYLPDRIFKRLLRFLFQLLNDKGMLVVTYKDKDIRFPSLPPEWFCDWDFIKRGKDDLIKAAEELGTDKYSLKIEREGTGTIFFLKVTKT